VIRCSRSAARGSLHLPQKPESLPPPAVLLRPSAARPGGAAFALIVLAAAWLSTAGAIGLLEPTETRYAEIAREMKASGDYLVPRLNGVPHFHKPPLAYWATALASSRWRERLGARIPAALACLAGLALAVRSRADASPRSASLRPRGVDRGTMPLVFFLGRAVATDPYLGVSVSAFWRWRPRPGRWPRWGWILRQGTGRLRHHGAPGAGRGGVRRDRGCLRVLGRRGAGGCSQPSPCPGTWSWCCARGPDRLPAREPSLGTLHHPRARAARPPWYFVGVLLVGALPWTAALVTGAARLWRRRAQREAQLLLAWLLVPLVFFSFSAPSCPPTSAVRHGRGLIAAVGLTDADAAFDGSPRLLAAMALAGWTLGPGALGG